ncbi:MAG: ribosome small subunit-dependent GTPase A [Flavobacteriaceae bacterium]
MNKGLVYRSTGSRCTVKSADTFYECRIKGKLRLQGIKSTNPVAVGDVVVFEADKIHPNEGNIVSVEERKNYIVRKSVNLSKQTHIIASNIDQVFLLVTLFQPPTFPAFIDRFLVTAEAYHIPAIVVFNKIDTYDSTELVALEHLQKVYSDIGYETFTISAKSGQDIEKIKQKMKGKVSMFAGHSGVGKSTVINSIAPHLQLKTSPLSSHHNQGTHTTTFAEMFDLDQAIRIIDTPGIKGFGVVDMTKDEISGYFPEFKKIQGQCKFHNCMHLNEPQCAVLEGVTKGTIAESRYLSYVQLLEEDSLYR